MISDKQPANSIKKIFGYIFPFILTILFLFLAFRKIDVAKSLELIIEIKIGWLVIFILIFFISHIIRALRWRIMLTSVKRDASLLNLFGAVMVGYGVNCIVPRLGEIYRALFAGKWENISRTSMFGSIIIERVIDIIALGFAVLISVAIYSGNLYLEFKWLKVTVITGFFFMALLVLFIFLVVKLKDKFTSGIIKIITKLSSSFAEKISYIFTMLIEGFACLRGWKNYTMVFIYTAAIMLIYGYTSYLGMYLLNMHESQEVTYKMAWIVMTISAFGIVIPTPGGTGSYHFITISALVTLYGFNEELSAAFALLTHFISYVIFILTAISMIYIINLRRKKMNLPAENFFSVMKLNRE